MKRTGIKITAAALILVLFTSVFALFAPIHAEAASSLALNKTSMSLCLNRTYTLKPNTSKTAVWSSSDKSIATVSSTGKVTAKKAGTVYITAKVGSKSVKCKVVVKPHNCAKAYKIVHHKEKGHYETKTVYEWKKYIQCVCGALFFEAEDYEAHSEETDHTRYSGGTKQFPVEKKVWVVDKAAWDEKIPNGYECTRCKKTEGIHSWKLISKKNATCTKDGLKTYQCTHCKIAKKTKTIAAAGHDWKRISYKKATCTQDGLKTYKCSKCGGTKKKIVPKTHDWRKHTITEKSHTENKRWIKCYCDAGPFVDGASFDEHMDSLNHGSSVFYDQAVKFVDVPSKFYQKCADCGKKYKCTTHKWVHKDSEGMSQKRLIGHEMKQSYVCKKCHIVFYDKENWDKHAYNEEHSKYTLQQREVPIYKDEYLETRAARDYCAVCGTEKTQGSHKHNWVREDATGMYQVVVSKYITVDLYCCSACDYKSRDPIVLDNHIRTSGHGKKIETTTEVPFHEAHWVERTPAKSTCSICGATNPETPIKPAEPPKHVHSFVDTGVVPMDWTYANVDPDFDGPTNTHEKVDAANACVNCGYWFGSGDNFIEHYYDHIWGPNASSDCGGAYSLRTIYANYHLLECPCGAYRRGKLGYYEYYMYFNGNENLPTHIQLEDWQIEELGLPKP